MFPIRITRVAFLVFGFCLLGWVTAVGAESACDFSLKPPEGHPFGYKSRGDRCEGVYHQPVAGTTVVVASFIRSFADYDLHSDEPLTLTWAPLDDAKIHLRGVSTRRRFYYRMDAEIPGGNTTYRWPINILAALTLSRPNLGVTAWVQRSIDDAPRKVYLPLEIHQHLAAKRSSGYQLQLVPGRELTEVYVTLTQLDDAGKPAAVLQDANKLGYGYYPAERGFVVPISKLAQPGIYHLQLGIVLAGGGVASIDFWFYHAA